MKFSIYLGKKEGEKSIENSSQSNNITKLNESRIFNPHQPFSFDNFNNNSKNTFATVLAAGGNRQQKKFSQLPYHIFQKIILISHTQHHYLIKNYFLSRRFLDTTALAINKIALEFNFLIEHTGFPKELFLTNFRSLPEVMKNVCAHYIYQLLPTMEEYLKYPLVKPNLKYFSTADYCKNSEYFRGSEEHQNISFEVLKKISYQENNCLRFLNIGLKCLFKIYEFFRENSEGLLRFNLNQVEDLRIGSFIWKPETDLEIKLGALFPNVKYLELTYSQVIKISFSGMNKVILLKLASPLQAGSSTLISMGENLGPTVREMHFGRNSFHYKDPLGREISFKSYVVNLLPNFKHLYILVVTLFRDDVLDLPKVLSKNATLLTFLTIDFCQFEVKLPMLIKFLHALPTIILCIGGLTGEPRFSLDEDLNEVKNDYETYLLMPSDFEEMWNAFPNICNIQLQNFLQFLNTKSFQTNQQYMDPFAANCLINDLSCNIQIGWLKIFCKSEKMKWVQHKFNAVCKRIS